MATSSSPGVRPATITAQGWGWQHAGRPRPAVRDLDLRIEPGQRVLLLGPSGAGKSTLLHGMAGLLGDPDYDEERAESGRLLVDGEAAAAQRGRVGLVQQDPETQVVLSRVGDDVAFGAENLAVPRDEIWPRVTGSLAAVGLDLPLDHPTSALSGGQKQRLALAGILAMRPGVLLLDEPTANLDPKGVLEVRDAVVRTLEATGATLVVVEHRVAVWADVVDRVVVLGAGGGVVRDGPPQEVLTHQRHALAAAGVWVPGLAPQVGARRTTGPDPALLLSAQRLGVCREPSRRRCPARPAATNIEVQVKRGTALSVTGPNGAGKSALALTLAGLLPAHSGSLVAQERLRSHGTASGGYVGPDPCRWEPDELITRIGTVFQEPEHQFLTTTVQEEMAFGPRQLSRARHPGRWRAWRGRPAPEPAGRPGRVAELLERLRLEHLAEANPFTLSGGEKRRLSVATALATDPAVLVLDEPTFGQDATTWAELATVLRELLDAGTAVVSVTHDAEFVAALGGDRLDLPAPESPLSAQPVPTRGRGPLPRSHVERP